MKQVIQFLLHRSRTPIMLYFVGGLLQTIVPVNDDRKAPSQAMPKFVKPKLCNGHLGKKECSFKLHVGSRFQSKNSLSQELIDFLNLFMVLCSLPISYILFVSLQKY